MRTLCLAAGVAALALVAPAMSQEGKGGGPPGGKGGGPGGQGGAPKGGPGGGPGGQSKGGPGGPDRVRGEWKNGPDVARKGGDGGPDGPQGGRGGPDRAKGEWKRGPDVARNGGDWGPGAAPQDGPDWKSGPAGKGGPDRKGDREWKGEGPRGKGPDDRGPAFDAGAPAARFASRRWEGDGYRWNQRDHAIPVSYGCPPGLTPRGDACVAPRDLRRLQPGTGWADWYPVQYQNDDYEWGYGDGYLYRYADGSDGGGLGGLGGLGSGLGGGLGSLISAFIPLLGGGLFNGNSWPQQYKDYQVPDYYDRFYGSGYDGNYDYRYADDAIFAVNPGSNRIDSIAGLLTGDAWGVGQRMPVGYDLYNVPLQYRDRFADDADHMYRYSDGYVYDVDPSTQLVRAVSELLG
ncbi:hypothetical protein ACFSC3_05585 [Sphingomonas floccifaciens]|uniref:Uncharacterized protein n=1 Tax=Sphingomonas floccifaciens TaxID=1844115 RepID=A0ABW4NAF8_9SPHN